MNRIFLCIAEPGSPRLHTSVLSFISTAFSLSTVYHGWLSEQAGQTFLSVIPKTAELNSIAELKYLDQHIVGSLAYSVFAIELVRRM